MHIISIKGTIRKNNIKITLKFIVTLWFVNTIIMRHV